MTTSDPGCLGLRVAGAGLDALAAAANGGGEPSTELIRSVANELFRQLPGGAPSAAPTGFQSPLQAPTPAVGGFGFSPTSAAAPSFGGPASAVPSPSPSAGGFGLPGAPVSAVPLHEGDALDALLAPLFVAVPAVSTGVPAASVAPAQPAAPGIPALTTTVPAALLPSPSAGGFDVHAVRRDFPILQERVNGRQLVWFDNAATTQKPQAVIDRIAHFYAHENSNIHRAAHALAARSTDAYEGARETVRRFLNARSAEEIVFVRGATEGINLVANAWGRRHVKAGDEIVLTHLEHHANIVPWQHLAETVGARIRVAPVDDHGQIILAEYERLLSPRTKLVALTQVSNALGTVTPAREMIAMAKRHGATVLVDGAQSVSHMRVDVQSLGADFLVFSGHKIFAPTGIGAVYGRKEVLERMDPYQRGGNMIADVTFERSTFQAPPSLFEAGTGNIADAVGLGAALEYVERIGIERIGAYEHELVAYGTHLLRQVPGVRLIGTAEHKASVLSFVLNGFTTAEVGKALDKEGIAVRSGHHCAQPILRRFGIESTVRPSLAFYNTHAEVDLLATTLHRLVGGKAPRLH